MDVQYAALADCDVCINTAATLVNILCLVCGSRPTALRDPMAMERANLLNMAKLSIKGLIESALSFGRTLDSDYPPLQQFFVVMEHCLKHGLRGERLRGM